MEPKCAAEMGKTGIIDFLHLEGSMSHDSYLLAGAREILAMNYHILSNGMFLLIRQAGNESSYEHNICYCC